MVKLYTSEHYEQIQSWFIARNLNVPSETSLPTHGAIVENVAVGFLFCTDGDLAYIDFYVSNPKASRRDVLKAFDEITTNLILWAKEMDYSSILANTQFKSIEKMAVKHGFKNLGQYTSFARSL